MHGFDDVTLTWQGADYVVPANRQLKLIAKIEDALAGDDKEQAIAVLFRRNGVPHTRLAAAYGAALRYAGANVSDEEVYLSIHDDIAARSKEAVAIAIHRMLMGLVAIVSPPTARALAGPAGENAAGKKT